MMKMWRSPTHSLCADTSASVTVSPNEIWQGNAAAGEYAVSHWNSKSLTPTTHKCNTCAVHINMTRDG